MSKIFKPMKAPNEEVVFEPVKNNKSIHVNDLNYPLMASYKLDGIRCIFKDGEMLTASLKHIQNKQLQEKFQPLKDYSKRTGFVLDGEIYSHDVHFSMIGSCCNTIDCFTKLNSKKWVELQEKHDCYMSREDALDAIKFHCFDSLGRNEDSSFATDVEYSKRVTCLALDSQDEKEFIDLLVVLKQQYVYNGTETEILFEKILEEGYEGLILRHPGSPYKFGRGTLKQGIIYKIKPWRTFDAKILAITQGTDVDPNAEKKINELGRSVTSNKKGDRILVERMKDFTVDYNGHKLDVASSSVTHKERKRLWKIKDSLVGKYIEYKGMLVGAKDVPRHPVFIRFREDKD